MVQLFLVLRCVKTSRFFDTCRDDQERIGEEDFHLCPHITKAMQSTAPPTAEDFLGSPAIPFTICAWTSFDRLPGAALVSNVLPPLWPAAVRNVISSMFGLNPLAVHVEEPISHRSYSSTFKQSPEP